MTPERSPRTWRGMWKRARRWAAKRIAPPAPPAHVEPAVGDPRDIIDAAYREILRRPADPGGLASYEKSFREKGMLNALPHMLASLLGSHEFQERVEMHALDALGAPGKRTVNGQKIAHIASLGTHCLAGFFLKKYQYKRYSLPFDWLYTSPEAVLHLFKDDFAEFLDPRHYVSMTGKKKDDDPGAEHQFYLERYKVSLMFAHRDPTNEEDLRHFERSVARFRQLMASPDGKLFVMIVRPLYDVTKSFATLSAMLRAATANSAFICIQLRHSTKTPGCHFVRRLQADGDHALYEFKPSSLENGLGFQEIVDDLMILRLIRQYDIDLVPFTADIPDATSATSHADILNDYKKPSAPPAAIAGGAHVDRKDSGSL